MQYFPSAGHLVHTYVGTFSEIAGLYKTQCIRSSFLWGVASKFTLQDQKRHVCNRINNQQAPKFNRPSIEGDDFDIPVDKHS